MPLYAKMLNQWISQKLFKFKVYYLVYIYIFIYIYAYINDQMKIFLLEVKVIL